MEHMAVSERPATNDAYARVEELLRGSAA